MNECYQSRISLPVALLLILATLRAALPQTNQTNSSTALMVNSPNVDANCDISIRTIDDLTSRTASAYRSDVTAICNVQSSYSASIDQTAAAHAGSINDANISPIIGYALPVTIRPRGGRLASVFVRNVSDRAVELKADIKEWRQDTFGQDVLVPSSAPVLSPKQARIEPGATRELHVQLPAATEHELAFRILLQQQLLGNGLPALHSVSTITQSLPAFSEPLQSSQSILLAHRIDPQHLLITNSGGRRARLVHIKYNGRIVASKLVAYALAHSSILVALDVPVHGGMVEIETDQGQRVTPIR